MRAFRWSRKQDAHSLAYYNLQMALASSPRASGISREVFEGIDLPLPSVPYPNDTLNYRGKMTVEFKTPAQNGGLGNFDSWLDKDDTPIVGAAILLGIPRESCEIFWTSRRRRLAWKPTCRNAGRFLSSLRIPKSRVS